MGVGACPHHRCRFGRRHPTRGTAADAVRADRRAHHGGGQARRVPHQGGPPPARRGLAPRRSPRPRRAGGGRRAGRRPVSRRAPRPAGWAPGRGAAAPARRGGLGVGRGERGGVLEDHSVPERVVPIHPPIVPPCPAQARRRPADGRDWGLPLTHLADAPAHMPCYPRSQTATDVLLRAHPPRGGAAKPRFC